MRPKQEILNDHNAEKDLPKIVSANANDCLFLEVLIDIRDQLAEMNEQHLAVLSNQVANVGFK